MRPKFPARHSNPVLARAAVVDRIKAILYKPALAALIAAACGGQFISARPLSPSQAAAPASTGPQQKTRLVGTVTAVNGNTISLKSDKGEDVQFTVSATARILQLPAGSKNLGTATTIKIDQVAIGDRVLANAAVSEDGKTFTAITVLAMKQADVAQKQQHDREDWQARGISGVVKSIDPTAQTINISTGSGATAKIVAVQASKATIIRRYAPDSVKFDDAKPASLDQIKPGDELQAKGDKNADGTRLAAEDIVAGTFQNIAGTVAAVDAGANTVTINNLATKKPFIIHVNPDSQLHKLPPMMAQGIAMRLKGGAADSSGKSGGGRPGDHAGGAPNPAGGPDAAPGKTTHGGGDLQQVLNRAPSFQLSELKTGDALMVLTTEGQTPGSATAVTLIAGVEPLLQASPAASQSLLSASWNVSGAAGQEAQQ